MKAVSIIVIVDLAAALSNDSLSGNIYLFDNNRSLGSSGEGTEALQTTVQAGDQVIWQCNSLESEAHVAVAKVTIDEALKEYCDPQPITVPGTSYTYWAGNIKKTPTVAIPYSLTLTLASREEGLSTSPSACLVGGGA